MDNWKQFISSVESISLDESKVKLNDVIKQLDIPETYQEVISSAAFLLLEAYKNNKSAPREEAIKTLTEIEKSSPPELRVEVGYSIGLILFGYSQLFTDQVQIGLLLNASEFFQKTVSINPQHMGTLTALKETYLILSNITSDNQKMFYSTKSREFNKYIEAVTKGEDFKVAPSTYIKIETAKTLKEKATEFFKVGNIKDALVNYHYAKNYITGLMDLNTEKEKEIKAMRIILLNNIAVCLMKQNKFENAIRSLDEVLVEEPKNVKALFRRGKSHSALKNFTQAENDLQAANAITPGDKEIVAEIALLKQRAKSQNQREGKAFAKVFDD
ncbi:hypothetical protein PPL_09033 [Heterostelium album PN500]|uniref:Tetratricopeptide repeat protein n=1 Tax=Heterostelium pallidum (strain ATCC 26659 / Pp 5 / PN500) TaxID=670386 RepID=D3BKF2_HETP5|nr:hypothetical protein PPL_09033 [Heterostelium album PN500]EFA78382.1 hypothetical protein PPL_09033 [Heterostelium album PN500]|eukprot:XP_020430507.1 hypothetical protein PPL_09033 [Heterostelium album PN500]